MDAIVFEHVPVAELPPQWRARLGESTASTVTVRIEAEPAAAAPLDDFETDDPAFGIWRDRDETADVQAYVRRLRAPRIGRDGSRNQR